MNVSSQETERRPKLRLHGSWRRLASEPWTFWRAVSFSTAYYGVLRHTGVCSGPSWKQNIFPEGLVDPQGSSRSLGPRCTVVHVHLFKRATHRLKTVEGNSALYDIKES